MVGVVYKAVVADKVYIGKTTSKFESRVKTHINHAFKQGYKMKISEALRTLTIEEAFKCFEIVETIEADDYETLERKLCERENYWMEHLNAIYPNGYNIAKSSPSKKHSVTTQPPRKSVMREVICVETNETFKSMTDAARRVGVNISAIYHCLKGKTNTAGNKHWRYTDGEYHECTRPEGRRNKKSQSKPVMCKETGVVYPSCGEASRQTGIIQSSIAKCANGKMITAGGYKWGFVIDGSPVFHEIQDKNKCRIMCLETGEIFESIAECARSLGDKGPGTLKTTIDFGCRHKGRTYVKVDLEGNPVPSPAKAGKV